MANIKTLDDAFSLYIRLRDAAPFSGICSCCTCGRPVFWKNIHNGHFMPRQHMSTRFHEQNAHAQCVNCNSFEEGQQYLYSLFLIKKYGQNTPNMLLILSKKMRKFDAYEISIMTEHYRNEAAKLKQQKHL